MPTPKYTFSPHAKAKAQRNQRGIQPILYIPTDVRSTLSLADVLQYVRGITSWQEEAQAWFYRWCGQTFRNYSPIYAKATLTKAQIENYLDWSGDYWTSLHRHVENAAGFAPENEMLLFLDCVASRDYGAHAGYSIGIDRYRNDPENVVTWPGPGRTGLAGAEFDIMCGFPDPYVGVDSGTAEGTSPTTLTDNNKNWGTNQWVDGSFVECGGKQMTITSNTGQILTGTGGWSGGGTPAAGAYRIRQPRPWWCPDAQNHRGAASHELGHCFSWLADLVPDGGTAEAVTNFTLTDNDKNWEVNKWNHATLTSGGKTMEIISNTDKVLTGMGWSGGGNPGAGDYNLGFGNNLMYAWWNWPDINFLEDWQAEILRRSPFLR